MTNDSGGQTEKTKITIDIESQNQTPHDLANRFPALLKADVGDSLLQLALGEWPSHKTFELLVLLLTALESLYVPSAMPSKIGDS